MYDPELAARKKPGQSKAFIPITASHRESIQGAIFRTMVGARPPLEMRARIEQSNDQSDNIRDLILREMEKSRFELEFNKLLEDTTTFGSGFGRIRWEVKNELRKVRTLKASPIDPTNPQEVQAALSGMIPPQIAEQVEVVETYRGIVFEHLSIWDIFPDPQALKIEGNAIAHRYYTTYGEIVAGVEAGYYLPECLLALANHEDRRDTQDTQQVKADRDQDSNQDSLQRNPHGRVLRCFELEAKLPRKWVSPDSEGDPETLIAAKVRFHEKAVIMVEPSEAYDGEASVVKLDYVPVNGQFYGRGIPEMLKDLQEITNEIVNQRLDNVALVLDKKFGVIESAMVDPNDCTLEPGGGSMIRLDGKKVRDVREALMQIDIPDVTKSAYIDVQEMERYAQERTSANRTTLGTQGQVKDANQTLGGMQLLQQSAGEKFAYIGMLMEFGGLKSIFRKYWVELYANIEPQDVIDALGPEKAATFQLLTPEQIEKQYIYEPQGVYTMENKMQTQAGLTALYQTFAGQPWLNPMSIFDRIAKSRNLTPDTLKYSPQEMQQMMMAQNMLQQGQAPIPDQPPAPPADDRDDETQLDDIAARVAVKKGLVSPADAAERLKLKRGKSKK